MPAIAATSRAGPQVRRRLGRRRGSAPDLNTIGAIEDCRKGNYAKGIPYLEKRLRNSQVTPFPLAHDTLSSLPVSFR